MYIYTTYLVQTQIILILTSIYFFNTMLQTSSIFINIQCELKFRNNIKFHTRNLLNLNLPTNNLFR